MKPSLPLIIGPLARSIHEIRDISAEAGVEGANIPANCGADQKNAFLDE
jgi:hypothetical protein